MSCRHRNEVGNIDGPKEGLAEDGVRDGTLVEGLLDGEIVLGAFVGVEVGQPGPRFTSEAVVLPPRRHLSLLLDQPHGLLQSLLHVILAQSTVGASDGRVVGIIVGNTVGANVGLVDVG